MHPLDPRASRATDESLPTGHRAFLLFQVGPVQEFIAQARKARDLWSGSYLISYLAARAMFAVAKSLGEKAIVYPALADAPLWRLALGERPDANKLRTPCLPNRFLALVPAGKGESLARLARAAVLEAWDKIQQSVRDEVQREVGAAHGDWATAWEVQIARFPQIDWSVHPWSDAATARARALSDPPVPPLTPKVRGAATGEIRDGAAPGGSMGAALRDGGLEIRCSKKRALVRRVAAPRGAARDGQQGLSRRTQRSARRTRSRRFLARGRGEVGR
jgi:hypothetical protein